MVDARTKIRCYVSPAGNNKIADWYADLSSQDQADAGEFVSLMRKKREWVMPDYRSRLRDGDNLGELRWVSGKKQHRLLGFFQGGYWFAVMGCTHKQKIYAPADALETAKRRKKQIENGEVETVDYEL